jgi:FkbH-like protein
VSRLFTELAWLPSPPADLRQRCKALLNAEDGVGQEIMRHASHALDGNQLTWLAKAIDRLRDQGRSLAPLTPFRLGVVGNGTLDLLVGPLTATAARFGIALECVMSDYDQILQPATNADSALHRAKPDAVLLVIDYRGLPWRMGADLAEQSAAEVEGALDFIATIRRGIRTHSNAPCIISSLAPPAEALFGSLDRAIAGTPRHMVDELNRQLVASLATSQDIFLDVAALADTVGLATWHDVNEWNMAKLPFASVVVPLYADHVCRLIGALRGKSRRCLILDLDNTLWSGVIGDDGLEGIVVAQGDATGEAFLAVQRLAMELRNRGVVLAVCSKNDDAVARRGFTHPEMLLKIDQIAVFQANWNDKAANIRAIAAELSLGLDAMVFMDDNPVERGLVREILPEVAVVELPDDPAFYARTLAAAGYFEAVAYSNEDRSRADFYQDNARRVALQKEGEGVEAYLTSLEMIITFQPFEPAGRARIAQLINKSNQFNLTTRRYTELDVAAAEASCFTLQIRLADRFGDNGMISVIICREAGRDTWDIDTWLMSCRVLGRGVEVAVLQEILAHARARGIRTLLGVYRPTSRNGMVSEHYAKLGFTLVETQPDGSVHWQLDMDETALLALYFMTVRRIGFENHVGELAH